MLTREKIKLLRHSRNWSQEYFAEKLGMSPNGYGAIERGDSSITLEKLEKIAQLLEVPLTELCDDGGNVLIWRVQIITTQQHIFNALSIHQNVRK
jgi:Predicted transcription factor, homolog of eukaryotic MBF1